MEFMHSGRRLSLVALQVRRVTGAGHVSDFDRWRTTRQGRRLRGDYGSGFRVVKIAGQAKEME